MAGGVFIGETIAASVGFQAHFPLKAGFVGGVFDVAFAGDDISFFGPEKGADVMNRLTIMIILTRQRTIFLPSGVFVKVFSRILVKNRLRSVKNRHIFL
jgi:hypothetical protein